MRVLFVTRGYPTANYANYGVFEYDQAKALERAGHEIIYAAIDLRSIRRWRKWGFEHFERDGIRIEAINIPLGRVPKIILDKVRSMALKTLYRKIVKRYGTPDLIHAHFIASGDAAIQVFGDQGIPLVHTEHYSAMHKDKLDPYYLKMGNRTYRHMDRVIAVSRSLKESILSHFNISSVVIPNIVDTQVFLRGEVNEKKDGPFFAFISVGRLIPLKRMDLLIRSFKQAFSDDPSVKLYIYGDGPERSRLGQLIRSSSLENQVFLMGFRSREDIAKKMAECDAFVLASDSETFGVVFIEAMAAGLPVIATYCGGPEDFVDDRYGILVKSGDESALTQAFREMRASHDRFNQIAISEEISARFNAEEIAAQIVDVYNAVTKNCL